MGIITKNQRHKRNGLVLYQPQNGYCYNSDTHFLYHFIVQNLNAFKNNQGQLLDIGSGSGILGLLIKRDFPKFHLNQSEVQEEFVWLSSKNAQTNGLENRMYEGDFLTQNFEQQQFDVCISNPPFYHGSVIKSENKILKIARYNDSMPLEKFIRKTYDILKPKGKFFFCYDVKQINDIILLLNKYKFNIESMQFIYPKRDRDATLVLIYARKNSKSLTKVFPPLMVFENEDFTQDVQNIYEKTQTHSIKVEI